MYSSRKSITNKIENKSYNKKLNDNNTINDSDTPHGKTPTEPFYSVESDNDNNYHITNNNSPNIYNHNHQHNDISNSNVNINRVNNISRPSNNNNYYLSSRHSIIQKTTKRFQYFMFIIFFVMLILSLLVKNQNISSGILFGSGLSFISVICVIISYISEPSYRRHPNPLIFWRTIADTIFILRLLTEQFIRCLFFDCKALCNSANIQCKCNFMHIDSSNNLCKFFSGLSQFSIFSSELWFCCMSLNLYFSLTNPFTDFKRNTRIFHITCWGLSLLTAIALISGNDLYGFSDLGICWTNSLRGREPVKSPDTCTSGTDNRESSKPLQANIISWGFFYIWVVMFIIIGIIVWLWAYKRLSEGMPETYAIRVKSINTARFYVISVTSYWVTVVIIYVMFLAGDSAVKHNAIYEIMNFLLSGKGYVDLLVWFTLNDFKIPTWSSIWKANIKEMDIDLNPQVNVALRREVLFYTTSGIIQAVEAAQRLPHTQRIQHLALLPQDANSIPSTNTNNDNINNSSRLMHTIGGTSTTPTGIPRDKLSERTKTFHDYEPHAFRRIRECYGVDKEHYLKSLSTTAKERLSEGASGAFMFFSGDGSLIVKSTSKDECRLLRSISEQYANYICANPKTLLTRFYGCHCLELYGNKFYFIVMANLFDTDQVIHSRYDIKGSWVNRNADLPKKGKKVTCRHCNRKYIYLSPAYDDNNCPNRLRGHEPNVVLKDNDLTQQLKLDEDVAIDLYKQIVADSNFLSSFGIMDYSLLLGVHDAEYRVQKSGIIGDEEENVHNKSELANALSRVNEGEESIILSDDESFHVNNSTEHQGIHLDDYNRGNLYSDMSSIILHTRDTAILGDQSPEMLQLMQSLGKMIKGRKPDKKIIAKEPLILSENEDFDSPERTKANIRNCMRFADTVIGPAYYHIGIIDILQIWTLKKKMERFIKITLKRADGNGLSAIQPKIYKERFQAKIADLLGVLSTDIVRQSFDSSSYIQRQSQETSLLRSPTMDSSSNVQITRSLDNTDHLVNLAGVGKSAFVRKAA